MHEKFEVLKKLGAGDFQHLNGSLEAHLKGTQKILESWDVKPYKLLVCFMRLMELQLLKKTWYH